MTFESWTLNSHSGISFFHMRRVREDSETFLNVILFLKKVVRCMKRYGDKANPIITLK